MANQKRKLIAIGADKARIIIGKFCKRKDLLSGMERRAKVQQLSPFSTAVSFLQWVS